MCMVAWPASLKIVGHGASWVHGAGEVTFVITSEISVLDGVAGGRGAPDAPERIDHQDTTAPGRCGRRRRTTSAVATEGHQRQEIVSGVAWKSCPHQLLMMRGVMKISSSVLVSFTASRLNSQPSSGMRLRPGVRSSAFCSWLT